MPVLTETPSEAPTKTSLPAIMNAPVSASTMRVATVLMASRSEALGQSTTNSSLAEPGHDVLHADRARDPIGDEYEELIARVVTEAVVHELEPVEVDEHHADDVVRAACVFDRVLGPVEQGAAVREAR